MSFSDTSICTTFRKKPSDKSIEERNNSLEFPIGDSLDISLKRTAQWFNLKRKSLLQKDDLDIKHKGDHQSQENLDYEDKTEIIFPEVTKLNKNESIETYDEPKNHYGRLGEHLKELWEQKHMSDVILRVDKKIFAAHKSVLTCYCPFLKRHLLARGNQNIQGIDLQNVDPESFEVLLNYMYTGQINVTCQNLAEIYNAARILEMEDVSQYCIKVLTKQNDSISSKLFLYATAKKLGIEKIWQKAFKVILHKFQEASNAPEFLDLDIEQLCEILNADYIGTDSEINIFLSSLKWLEHDFVEREKNAVRVMSCIRFPLMTMDEILSCYHPPFLPGIVEFPEVAGMLLKATCFIAARTEGREMKFHEYACHPRFFTRCVSRGQKRIKKVNKKAFEGKSYDVYPQHIMKIKYIIQIQSVLRGLGVRKRFKEERTQREFAALIVQTYRKGCIIRKKWRPFLGKTEIPGERVNHMMGPLWDPCLHLLLQHPSSTTLDSLNSCSTIRSSNSIPKIQNSLRLPDTAVLLAIGGINPTREEETTKGTTILRFNPKENLWEQWIRMPIHRHHHCSVLFHEKLYIIGGCDARDTLLGCLIPSRNCFSYDLREDEWSRIADMNHARLYHGAAEINGKIYVVGGKDENGKLLSSVEYYKPDIDKWSELQPSLCCARMAMGVAVHKELLWVVGGVIQFANESKSYINKDVECYDPTCKCWLSGISRLPTPRSFLSLVQCDDLLYVIGGTTRSYSTSESYVSSIDDIYVFDDIKNQWKFVASLSYPRHSISTAALDDKIYILGGVSTLQIDPLRECCILDTSTGTWDECAPLPVPLSGFSIVALSALEN